MPTETEFTYLTLAAGTRSPAERVASLQGQVGGTLYRIAELKANRAAKRIIEREEHSLRAYRRMLEEAESRLP